MLRILTISCALLLNTVPTSAGIIFSLQNGTETQKAFQSETQAFCQAVQQDAKDDALKAQERILAMLRDLPDKTRQSELMQEYLAIMAKLREDLQVSSNASKLLQRWTKDSPYEIEIQIKRLLMLASDNGSFIVTVSRSVK